MPTAPPSTVSFWHPVALFGFLIDFIKHFPDLLVLAALGIFFTLKRRERGLYFALAWISLTILLVSAQSFRPTRYYLLIIPPLGWLAAYALTCLFEQTKLRRVWLLTSLVMLLCSFQLIRLVPYYYQDRKANQEVEALLGWLDQRLDSQEAFVSSVYYTAFLTDHLVIPMTYFMTEYRAKPHNLETEIPSRPLRYLALIQSNPERLVLLQELQQAAPGIDFRETYRSGLHSVYEMVNKQPAY